MISKITQEIIKELKRIAPKLTSEQITRRNKIINSSNPNFVGYGHKISDIEKITKAIYVKFQCNYKDSIEVFKYLVKSNVHEEKFGAIFFLNHFKVHFNEEIIKIFEDAFSKYCDTWAFCDTSCIRVIGPYLGKSNNHALAKRTVNNWSNSEYLWVKRASIVILIKIIMIRKEFNNDYVYNYIEKMRRHHEIYIQKGLGWLLKTCSKYEPDSILKYLMKNKLKLTRLVLRYGSEKLPKEKRKLLFD
ncbi:MAG: DNA alkylation repair protein [Candidatus Hermodarchaeota archaeon]